MASTDTAAAHARDQADRYLLMELRRRINEFVADPPAKLSAGSRELLEVAAECLWEDVLHIDAVWD